MDASKPIRVLVMGVSGCGKSTLARAIAANLDARTIEGDDLHAPLSVEKMRLGIPLDDADREPWLDRIGQALGSSDGHVVATCSALKRAYRDRLRTHAPDLRVVYLEIDEAEATRRVGFRAGHLFPASLVASQFATLQRPMGERAVLRVDATAPGDVQLRTVTDWIAARP